MGFKLTQVSACPGFTRARRKAENDHVLTKPSPAHSRLDLEEGQRKELEEEQNLRGGKVRGIKTVF